jgi:hypothetical protein
MTTIATAPTDDIPLPHRSGSRHFEGDRVFWIMRGRDEGVAIITRYHCETLMGRGVPSQRGFEQQQR